MSPQHTTSARPPRTRTEARAAGLKVFAWGTYCRRCHSNVKRVSTGACVPCAEQAKEARRVRDKEVAARARAQVLRYAKAQALRDIQADQKRAAREAERDRREDERERQRAEHEEAKKAAARERINAKARATREANKAKATAAAAALPALDALTEVPPWDEPARPLSPTRAATDEAPAASPPWDAQPEHQSLEPSGANDAPPWA
jgi:hypothetical protein